MSLDHSQPAPQPAAADPLLFTPLALRGLALKNRIMLSPMAIYGARDGLTGDLHLIHYGRFALGGVGLIMVENTAVTEEGRITHGCPGLWRDEQAENLTRLTGFAHACGAAIGIQLSHCGRKGSSQRPWHGGAPLGEADAAREEHAWPIRAASAEPFDAGWPAPKALTLAEIDALVEDYRRATARARRAGFDVVEMHCAHGYLLHSFLSPLANARTDAYGGPLENRMRLPLRVAAAMRAEWPADRPVFARISSVDGVDIGWSLEDSVAFALALKGAGVDVVDCSSGGMKLPRGRSLVSRDRGFQVPFAARIRREAGIATVAVGLIRDPHHAEAVLAEGSADLIAVGREALFNPNWAVSAALALKGRGGWSSWQERYGWWLERRAVQQGDVHGREG
ncbi:NADPH dehydrogenase [Methylobacterium crusticola]|uniref:NADPH dehydrogenase n=1 Tax=Methylobacterium crusticola TaxID=1697972 RepID=A0ABQ4QSZ8_9HYPH|nr:NADH:flavin oxidoreductase/NADH oxidase [Methylobacterium crusticola]GJD48359.1 NADPH dehydrogenase [Methylobacterium crusticola]